MELCREHANKTIFWVNEMVSRSIHRLSVAESLSGRSGLETENADLKRQLERVEAEKKEALAELEKKSIVLEGYTEEIVELRGKLGDTVSQVGELERQAKHLQEVGHDLDCKLIASEGNRLAAVEEAAKLRLQLDQVVLDVEWMLKEGIPFSLVHLLRSPEYGQANVKVQGACVKYGMHKGCAEMKEKYLSHVPSAVPVYSFPDSLKQVGSWFDALLAEDFTFLKKLKSGEISLAVLKEMLRGEAKLVPGGVGGSKPVEKAPEDGVDA